MFVIEVVVRIAIGIVAALCALGMIEHLMSGLYPNFTGAMIAYLSGALLAFGSLAWPTRLNATRWILCAPYFTLTLLGMAVAYSPSISAWVFKHLFY